MVSNTVFFIAVLLFVGTAQATNEVCKVGFSSSIQDRCVTPTGVCKLANGCSIRYRMSGFWQTLINGTPNLAACNNICNNHFRQCVSKCTFFSTSNDVPPTGTDKCRCFRTVPNSTVRNACIARCNVARNVCVFGCSNNNKCPIRAVTNMSFNQVFRGACQEWC